MWCVCASCLLVNFCFFFFFAEQRAAHCFIGKWSRWSRALKAKTKQKSCYCFLFVAPQRVREWDWPKQTIRCNYLLSARFALVRLCASRTCILWLCPCNKKWRLFWNCKLTFHIIDASFWDRYHHRCFHSLQSCLKWVYNVNPRKRSHTIRTFNNVALNPLKFIV